MGRRVLLTGLMAASSLFLSTMTVMPGGNDPDGRTALMDGKAKQSESSRCFASSGGRLGTRANLVKSYHCVGALVGVKSVPSRRWRSAPRRTDRVDKGSRAVSKHVDLTRGLVQNASRMRSPPTVPRLLPGTGPRRCPCSRPCVRRPHRNLTRISGFWRPFSDAATEREPLRAGLPAGCSTPFTPSEPPIGTPGWLPMMQGLWGGIS